MADQDISKRIFVKGFTRETTESELRIFFEEYGVVKESKIVRDKHGVSKGYAFITFESQDVADDLREKPEGLDFKDKLLSIGKAIRRKSSRPYSSKHYWHPRQEMFHEGAGPSVFYSSTSMGMDGVYYPVQQPQIMVLSPPTYSQQLGGYPSHNLYQPNPHSSAQHLYSPGATAMVGGQYVTAAQLPMQWGDYATSFNRHRPISSSLETQLAVPDPTSPTIVSLDGNPAEITTQLVAMPMDPIKPTDKPIAVRFLKAEPQ